MSTKRRLRTHRTEIPRDLFRVTHKTPLETVLTRQQVVDILVQLVPPKTANEAVRARRTRLGTLVDDHAKKGRLQRRPDKTFFLYEVTRWARRRWPEYCGALRARPQVESGAVVAKAIASDTYDALALPGTLARCHEVVAAQHERITDLEKQLTNANARISELLPGAERHREVTDINRASARKPRPRDKERTKK